MIYQNAIINLISTKFVDFFKNKITNIRKSIQTTTHIDNIDANNTSSEQFSEFVSLSTNDITHLIRSFLNCSCPLDPIPTSLLKKCKQTLFQPLTDIINKSLLTGNFPPQWKKAIIMPLTKKQIYTSILKTIAL